MASSMITTAALALSASGALAQAATSTDAGPATTKVQELVVTGSRIPSANLTSVTPVVTVNATTIKLQGATNVEDIMSAIPSAYIDYGAYESNGSTGTATADLRNLGSVRTLVLIDGKRVQPGDPTVPVPDLNFIPPGLIDRVEVLTGGASAVYGSDAMAGVVNFIMKRDFQGLQIDAQTSISESGNSNQQVRNADKNSGVLGFPPIDFPTGAAWGGERYDVTITGGANSPDDKGNVEFYLGWTHIDPVDQGARAVSKCSLATDNTSTTFQYCGGSSTDATGRLTPSTGPNAGSSFNILGTPVNNTLPAFGYGQLFNYAPYNYFQRPDDRYTAGEFSHYEINKAIDLYSSFMFMDDHTSAAIAPSGSFYGDNTYTIPCNDPLLSSAQANTICGPAAGTSQTESVDIGRRNVEGGPRTSDLEHMDYRIVFGSKGDLGNGWTYDVSAQYGRSVLTDIEGGSVLNSKLVNALDVVPGPNGTPVCASGGSCVPYNIWSPGGVTTAALNYLSGEAISSGVTTEQVVTASVAGNLGQYGLKSPWASDGIGVSGGVEYRREFLETNYDATIQSGDLAGFGGSVKDTSGSQSDNDIFAEVRIPIIQNQPFFQNLTFDGGYRYSVYTSGGPNQTYKFALDWQTIPDLRIRASYERAVRAPNVQELFLPATPGLVAGSDPCAGSSPFLSATQCYNTIQHSFPGMSLTDFTNNVYGNITQCVSAQCGNYSGGNPNLTPETADTYSVGMVFTPTFLRGFSFSVDYFHIVVNQAIINLPLTAIMNNCAELDNSYDCALINRNPGTNYGIFGGNGVGYVDQPLVNAGSLKTDGIDFAGSYRMPLSMVHLPEYGSLLFTFNGTWVNNLTTVLPDGTSYNCVGLYGVTCGTPTPAWRSSLRMTWNTPWAVSLSLNWRFIDSANLDFNTNQPDLQNFYKDLTPTDAHIPTFNYFDLAATWKVKDRYTIRGGINNIFDRTAPLLDSNSFGISAPPFGNGNTYPQVYDPLGRVFFLGLTADF